MIDPKLDGITHINIYSKGSTELGRLLSNFAHTPFKHKEHGVFNSVEGYWYWLKTGMKHDELRKLYGFSAKNYGKGKEKVFIEGFNEFILEAIRYKLRQNKHILRMLVESSLPLDHYYWYGDVSNPKVYTLDRYRWIVDEIERIRVVCKQHSLKLEEK